MGLVADPDKAVSFHKRKVETLEVEVEERPKELVRKLSVLNDLEAETGLPGKKGNSWGLIDCVHYLVKTWEGPEGCGLG